MEPEESVACPVCGGELQPHIICPFCGTDITLKSLEGLEATYKCPVCGKEAQTKFICNECGSEFKYELITEKMGAVEAVKKEERKPAAKRSTPKTENLVELKGGLTNGLSTEKKRQKGLTNGLTNGLVGGKKKGAGLTNGLKGGMVNGTGVTNGTKPAKMPKTHKKSSKTPAVVAAVLVLLLILGAFYIFIMPHKGGIEIDGDFSDWNGVALKSEFKSASNPLDMVRYSSKVSDGSLFLYLEGRAGSRLFDTSGSRIYAFVDSDNNAATGYRINGIGADYLCKIYGEGGKITAHAAYSYESTGGGFSWTWGSSLPLSAAYSGNKLEMGFYPDNIGSNYRVAFYTSDADGNCEVSTVNIGEGTSLYFEAKPWDRTQDIYTADGNSTHLMDIGIFATGGDSTIQAITFTVEHIHDITLRDTSGNTVATMENNRITLNRAVNDGERVNYQLWGTFSGADGSLISLDVTQVIVGPASTILRQNTEPFKAYLGEPSSIAIDGAFGDWRNVNSDERDTSLPEHIDIRQYSGSNDTAHLYFYLGVQNDIMAGVLVPEKYVEGIPKPNPPVTPTEKTETGEDVLRIYIDTDNGRYKIEILGKEGKILSEDLYRYQGNTWGQPIASPGILAENDATRMEGEIPLNIIGNPSSISLRFEMSDWEGNLDVTDSLAPIDTQSQSTRYVDIDSTPVPEFSEMLIPILFTIGMALIVGRKKKQ